MGDKHQTTEDTGNVATKDEKISNHPVSPECRNKVTGMNSLDTVQCDRCGVHISEDEVAYSVEWCEWPTEGTRNQNSCWLCTECISVIPRAP
jgi:hypothetical protein